VGRDTGKAKDEGKSGTERSLEKSGGGGRGKVRRQEGMRIEKGKQGRRVGLAAGINEKEPMQNPR